MEQDPTRPRDGDWRGLGDPLMVLVLLVTLTLQLFTWSQLQGYQLADSVEYMERAQALVRGEEVIDSQAIRSFGYVSILAPLFALADILGVEDFKGVVALVRLLQIAIGLGLVYATARLGARLVGRVGGLAAGLAVGANPYVLLYSVEPVSGLAAGLCVTLALDALLRFEGFKRGLIGGAWLGGALLMAYKTLVIALPLLAVLALVGRRGSWRSWVGAWCGYGLGLLGAVSLDKLCYGDWGKSLDLYARMNFGPLGTRFAARLGFMDLAKWFWDYADGERNAYYAAPESAPGELLHEPNPLYHLTHLSEMVVWPLLFLLVLGSVWALWRGGRQARLILGLFLFSASVLSLKRSTEFRLLLPVVGCIGVLVGAGVAWSASRSAARRGAALLLAAGVVLGPLRVLERTTSRYAGFWEAMRVVDALAAGRGASAAPLKVASAWHWAVYLREGAGVELVKLPHQLDRWRGFDDAWREHDLAALDELDAFIAHLAVLLEHPDLFKQVNARFGVETVLFEREDYADLGPIVVFTRRTGAVGERSFQSLTRGEAPLDFLDARNLTAGRRFAPADGSLDGALLTLLGWRLERLPSGGHAWLSLHWLRGSVAPAAGSLVRPRILSQEQELPWETQSTLGRGWVDLARWSEGEVLSEGWPVVATVAPFDPSQPLRPLYRGDGSPTPATLWLRVLSAPQGGEIRPLAPVTDEDGVLVTPAVLDASRRGPDGMRVTPEGFVELGEVELHAPSR